jgi:hypothetical protein
MPVITDTDLLLYNPAYTGLSFPIANMLSDWIPFEVLSVVPLGNFLETLLVAFINDLRNSINQSIYILGDQKVSVHLTITI